MGLVKRKLLVMATFMGSPFSVLSPAAAQAPSAPACVGTPSDIWLNVIVQDVRSGNGLIAITLYADDRSRFLVKRGSLAVMRVPAQADEARACIFLPAAGTYAVAVYHDEDGDQTFDRSGLGFPKEGFGFSNNPPTLAGLPGFSAVRLGVPRTGLQTRIRLKYP